MALNSYITKEGLEMGRAQVMQAEAAGIEPSADMNPILLKPTNDTGSQIIVRGRPFGMMSASEYYKRKKEFIPSIMESYRKLDETYDVIVIEGAGSPAEINLKKDDIVNMGFAKMADAPVLLVGDIDRGGVFAQLAGTMLLLEEEEKKRVGRINLSVPQMYLILAENAIDNNLIDDAMDYLDKIRVGRFFPEDYHALKGSVTTKTEAIGMLRKVAHGENVFNIYDFITLKRWTLLDDYKEDISWTYSGTTYTLKPESTIWVFPFPKNLMEKNGNFEHNYPVTQN